VISELKPGLHIEEFVSGGPKNYAYRTVNATMGEHETVCKVHGKTLNYRDSTLVNYDAMRYMILRGNKTHRVAVHTEQNIKRKRAGGRIDIITEPEDKMYRVSFLRDEVSPTIHPFPLANKRTLSGSDVSHVS
jgi:transcription-repair coupling factor (superfamily II helicase)